MTQTPAARFADDAHRYRLDSRIATGGMGEVWRATDTMLEREVAVKVLKDDIAEDPVFRSRFETEARHAAALHHPGIAAVFDVGERAASEAGGQPRPFLVMELVDGQPLSALLSQGRDLDPAAVRDLMAQVGDALGAAHRAGIIHRDVKPANLIVTPDGKVKVTDFGIARAADGAQITRTGAVMGTPQYLSPEQAEGKPATIASDVYSLGVVTFECLAGRRPFDAESPVATALAHIREPVPDLPASVPQDLASVVRTALSKDPGERYADGAAMAAALRDPGTAVVPRPPRVVPAVAPVPEEPRTQVMPATPVADAPVPVPPATSTTSTAAQPSRSAAGPVVAAVVLLVALAVVLTLLLTGGDDDEPAAGDVLDSTPASTEPTTDEASTEPTSEPPTEEPSITLNEGEFVGRDFAQVDADLRGMGLRVEPNEQANDNPDQNGRVTALNPNGEVEPNELILVTYFGDAPEPTPAPTPTPTPTPTPEPTPTPSPLLPNP